MEKYQLVGVYGDGKTKKFCNEKPILFEKNLLPEINIIDKFTSGRTGVDLWNEIAKYNDISDINTLLIKYTKDDGSEPIYMPVIIDNEYILNVTYNCKNEESIIDNKKGRCFINKNNNKFKYVCSAFFNLFLSYITDKEKSISSKNIEHMDRLLKYNPFLKENIDACINKDELLEKDFAMLQDILSEYQTYRNVIIGELSISNNWISSYKCYKDYIIRRDIITKTEKERERQEKVKFDMDLINNEKNDLKKGERLENIDEDNRDLKKDCLKVIASKNNKDMVDGKEPEENIKYTKIVIDGKEIPYLVYHEHEKRPPNTKRRR